MAAVASVRGPGPTLLFFLGPSWPFQTGYFCLSELTAELYRPRSSHAQGSTITWAASPRVACSSTLAEQGIRTLLLLASGAYLPQRLDFHPRSAADLR
jgi:hypothetical protein